MASIKSKPNAKGGRPAFEPTKAQRATVAALVRAGVPQDEVAAVLEISPTTLRAHFRRELDAAMAEANGKVTSWLFELCRAKNLTAIIFWLKCRAGWKDQPSSDAARDTKAPDFVVELTGVAASKEKLQ